MPYWVDMGEYVSYLAQLGYLSYLAQSRYLRWPLVTTTLVLTLLQICYKFYVSYLAQSRYLRLPLVMTLVFTVVQLFVKPLVLTLVSTFWYFRKTFGTVFVKPLVLALVLTLVP